jgi:hypothetical protein
VLQSLDVTPQEEADNIVLQREAQDIKEEGRRTVEDLRAEGLQVPDIQLAEATQPELIFENKPIPKQLIDQYRKNQAAEERANVSMSGPNKAAQTRTWQTLSRMYTDFLGVDPRSNWTMSPRFYALQDILQREANKPTQLAEATQPIYYRGTPEEYEDIAGTGGVVYFSPNRKEAEIVGGKVVKPYSLMLIIPLILIIKNMSNKY